MLTKVVFFGLFAILGIMLIPSSDAALLDLIIKTNVEYSPSFPDAPIIVGIITDHASKPMKDAEVSIRTGEGSMITYSDEDGKFRLQLNNIKRITGNYIVNIIANTPDGKTGMTSTEFQVIGEFTKTSIIEAKLSTPEAIKYLSANPDEFGKDPIGYILYNHYQKLLQEYFDAESENIPEYQKYIEAQKRTDNLLLDNIKSTNNFSGNTYEGYLISLEPSIRDIVADQLNLTIKIFDEAQQIKNNIIENGGSEEEARLTYLEYIAISKEAIENFGFNTRDQNMADNTRENLQNSQITLNGESIIIQSDISGTKIMVEGNGKSFVTNVDGMIVNFYIDENKNIQIDNFED